MISVVSSIDMIPRDRKQSSKTECTSNKKIYPAEQFHKMLDIEVKKLEVSK